MTPLKTLIASGLACAMLAGAAGASSVTLDPAAGPFEVNDTIVIEAVANTGTDEFRGFEGTLDFDDTVLSLDSVLINPVFTFAIPPASLTPNALFAASGLPGQEQSGETVLATFSFTALAEGTTSVFLNDTEIGTSINGQFASLFSGDLATAIAIGDQADNVVIPLPASVLFLMSGVGGLAMFGRRRRG